VQGIVPKLPIDLRVGYIKDSFEGAAFERQTEAVTDYTPGPSQPTIYLAVIVWLASSPVFT
jgi:hypothetical protein